MRSSRAAAKGPAARRTATLGGNCARLRLSWRFHAARRSIPALCACGSMSRSSTGTARCLRSIGTCDLGAFVHITVPYRLSNGCQGEDCRDSLAHILRTVWRIWLENKKAGKRITPFTCYLSGWGRGIRTPVTGTKKKRQLILCRLPALLQAIYLRILRRLRQKRRCCTMMPQRFCGNFAAHFAAGSGGDALSVNASP